MDFGIVSSFGFSLVSSLIWIKVVFFFSFLVLSMGALDEGHFCLELENGMKLDVSDQGLEKEPETIVIEDAVKVLLQGLGEDVNREGLKKTPRRVAKALREGTRGSFFL